jgi:hypothetical protein
MDAEQLPAERDGTIGAVERLVLSIVPTAVPSGNGYIPDG